MKRFLVRLFAVIGVATTLLVALVAYGVWQGAKRPVPPKVPDSIILTLDLTNAVREEEAGLPATLRSLFLEEEEPSGTTLASITQALRRAADDPRVKGVVAQLGARQPGFVHAQEIRDAVALFRKTGKFSYIFAPSYGGFGQGNRSYYLASAFGNVWLQPVGTVGLTALGIEAPFFKSALGSVGVGADFLQREDYKSAMENVTRDGWSAPARAATEAVLRGMQRQIAEGVAQARGLDATRLAALMAQGPFTGAEAVREGLVTRLGYADEMRETARLLATAPAKPDAASEAPAELDPATYLALTEPAAPAPRATVAVIHALGMIVEEAEDPSGVSDEYVMDTRRVVAAFEAAAKDKKVQAILFRVDSPGGSPVASETIRRAMMRARDAGKKVVVSMGTVAASGGYWIAMDADHIVAAPGTLTGSIGVIAGKFYLAGLWKKLGVAWDDVSLGDNARLWSSRAPFSPKDRERVNALLDDTYKMFLDAAGTARKIPPDRMRDLAKGRVWLGEDAARNGLVDETGGIETALAAIRKKLGLAETDRLKLQPFPAPETTADFVMRIARHFATETASTRQMLGSLAQARAAFGPVLEEVAPRLVAPEARRLSDLPPALLRAVR